MPSLYGHYCTATRDGSNPSLLLIASGVKDEDGWTSLTSACRASVHVQAQRLHIQINTVRDDVYTLWRLLSCGQNANMCSISEELLWEM